MKSKKDIQLGIPLQTARQRLIKSLLFKLIKDQHINYCYRCSAEIEQASDLSIEHKEFWSTSEDPLKTYMDLENIAFSHLSCNSKYTSLRGVKHPSHRAYNEGCRCTGCKEVEAERRRKQRSKKT